MMLGGKYTVPFTGEYYLRNEKVFKVFVAGDVLEERHMILFINGTSSTGIKLKKWPFNISYVQPYVK